MVKFVKDHYRQVQFPQWHALFTLWRALPSEAMQGILRQGDREMAKDLLIFLSITNKFIFSFFILQVKNFGLETSMKLGMSNS